MNEKKKSDFSEQIETLNQKYADTKTSLYKGAFGGCRFCGGIGCLGCQKEKKSVERSKR